VLQSSLPLSRICLLRFTATKHLRAEILIRYRVVIRVNNKDICQNTKQKAKTKDKAVPLQASSGPVGSRRLRFPDFMTTAQDGGKVVSRTHRPPLPPGNAPGIHFC